VQNGQVASPFGHRIAKSMPEGAQVDIVYRADAVKLSETGVPAEVIAVRPYAGRLDIEAAIDISALPEGAQSPMLVRASAHLEAVIAPGGRIRLAARPEDAFIYPATGTPVRS